MLSDSKEADEKAKGVSFSRAFFAPKVLVPVGCFIICLAISGCMVYYGSVNVVQYILKQIPAKPGVSWQLSYASALTLSIVMLLPIWPPLCMGSGLIFGFREGTLISFCSILAAANFSFCIGRVFLKEPVRNCIDRGDYPRMRRLFLVLEDEGNSLQFQVLFRFLFIPMFIRNYGPSTLEVPLWKLSLGSVPHSLWISLLFASLGATFKDMAELLRDGKEFQFSALKWQQGLVAGAAITISFCLAGYAHRKYMEKLDKEETKDLI